MDCMLLSTTQNCGPEISGPYLIGVCLYALLFLMSIQCKLLFSQSLLPGFFSRLTRLVAWLVVGLPADPMLTLEPAQL